MGVFLYNKAGLERSPGAFLLFLQSLSPKLPAAASNARKPTIQSPNNRRRLSFNMAKKKHKRRRGCAHFLFCWLLILLGLGGGAFYAWRVLGSYEYNPINEDNLAVSAVSQQYADKVTNIALFGVDSRSGEGSRSDAMMILSVDSKRGCIKLSSLMRDAYVAVDGHGQTKLCHAYAYGGPELAVKTINQNFQMDIREYATVNFTQMADIVDAVGGVELEVSEGEMEEANKALWEYCVLNDLIWDDYKFIAPGLQTLNGPQAVAYGRIRKGSTGGDGARTGRQQEILEKMLQKALDMSALKYPALAARLMPLVETSMSAADLLDLAAQVLSHGRPQIQRATFPCEGDWSDKTTSSGLSVVAYDDALAVDRLHKFIYDDISIEDQKAAENQP